MITKRVVAWLLVGALGLPIVLCLLFALAQLLGAMQDAAGALAVLRVCLGLGVLWVVNLVALVIVPAVNSLDEPRDDGPRDP